MVAIAVHSIVVWSVRLGWMSMNSMWLDCYSMGEPISVVHDGRRGLMLRIPYQRATTLSVIGLMFIRDYGCH